MAIARLRTVNHCAKSASQQHWRSRTEALDGRTGRRGDGPFADVRLSRGRFVSRPVQRSALGAAQFPQHRLV
ncbi:hypothetical protein, partial [Mycolicibacter heraklionensis]|uniref:hypothetical protein n=1 Tax=Mycolicibacter heraklionensis TaxID=512402 RepID=UPI001A9658AE